jgi:hypothetical protein
MNNERKAELDRNYNAAKSLDEQIKRLTSDINKAIQGKSDTSREGGVQQLQAQVTRLQGLITQAKADFATPCYNGKGEQCDAIAISGAETAINNSGLRAANEVNIANSVRYATQGNGTDDRGLANAINQINAGNIVQVMDSNNSLVSQIMGDVSGNDQKKYATQLISNLEQAATAAGVNINTPELRALKPNESMDLGSNRNDGAIKIYTTELRKAIIARQSAATEEG